MAAQVADTVILPPIVSVVRRADSLRHVPFAVTALTIRADQVPTGRSLVDLLAFVPGLGVADRGNPSRDDAFSIRGAGARASFGVRGIRVLLDGIPQTLPDGQTQLSAVDPSRITRVEVLRGAGSALYGNAAGGAILLSTGAGAAASGLRADLRVGSGNGRRLSVSGGAAGAGRSATVSLTRELADGWREHASHSNWRGALQAAARVSSGWRLSVQSTVTHQPRVDDPGPLTAVEMAADPRQAAAAYLAADARKRVTHVQGGVSARHRMDRTDVEFAVWGQRRDLQNPLPFVDITLDRQALGGRAAFTWRVGPTLSLDASFEAQRLVDDRVNRDPGTGNPTRDQVERVRELAPAVQARWWPSARVAVTGAARFDAVQFALEDRAVADGDDSSIRTLTAPSASLGVSFSAHPLVRPWVSVATSFETPTTTELTNRADGLRGFNPALEPERAVQAEAGVRIAGGKWSGELVAWRAWVREALVPFESPIEPGRIVYRNAGRVARRGLELAMHMQPAEQVSLDASATASEFRYDAFSTPSGVFDGNRVPGVPPWRAALRARAGRDGAWLAAEWHGAAWLWTDDANQGRADGWSVFHVRAGASQPLGQSVVTGWVAVENVLDRRYVSAVRVNATFGRFFDPGSGRRVTVSLAVAP